MTLYIYTIVCRSLIAEDKLQEEPRFRNLIYVAKDDEGGRDAVQLKYMYNAELSPYYVELDHKIDLVFEAALCVSLNLDCAVQWWETIGVIIEHFSGDQGPPLLPDVPDDGMLASARAHTHIHTHTSLAAMWGS